ncbi:hypothetical protein TNCV_2903961 [Trichonephila clavipes]|nr:hypothetical protein TNCV_2903961 [Trichonephila clavipes]
MTRVRDLDLPWSPKEGENPRGGQGPPTSLHLPPTTREDLRLDGYLEYPHAAKALYIDKHPCPPGFEPSPYGTAFIVGYNRYKPLYRLGDA